MSIAPMHHHHTSKIIMFHLKEPLKGLNIFWTITPGSLVTWSIYFLSVKVPLVWPLSYRIPQIKPSC